MAEERRRLLGDDVIADIHARVAEAPEPPPETVAELRRIFTCPLGPMPADGVLDVAETAA